MYDVMFATLIIEYAFAKLVPDAVIACFNASSVLHRTTYITTIMMVVM